MKKTFKFLGVMMIIYFIIVFITSQTKAPAVNTVLKVANPPAGFKLSLKM